MADDYFHNDNTQLVVTLFMFTWKKYKFHFYPPLPFMAAKGATVKYVIADKTFDIMIMADNMIELEKELKQKFCKIWEHIYFYAEELTEKEKHIKYILEKSLKVSVL